jgi:hypothetical protein
MPRFMDSHNDLVLDQATLAQLAADTKAHKADQFGVSQVELYYNDAGKAYCVLDGPDENAIRAHHEALGLTCGPVDQVDSLT